MYRSSVVMRSLFLCLEEFICYVNRGREFFDSTTGEFAQDCIRYLKPPIYSVVFNIPNYINLSFL